VTPPRDHWRPWLFALAAAVALLPHLARSFADPDLWWHVKTGEAILDRGSIPDRDLFSFTAAGASWVNHEWLSEVVLAGAFRLGGDRGLVALRLALLAAGCGLLAWLLWQRLPEPLPALVLLLAALRELAAFWSLRPNDASSILSLAFLACLEAYRGGRRSAVLALPLLMAVWVNLHGGFLLGLAIAAAGLGSFLLGWEGERPSRAERLRLAAVLAATLLAPLLNPYGPRLFVYLAHELGARHAFNTEWQSLPQEPGAWWPYASWALPPLALLAAGRAWRLRPAESALFALALVVAFRNVRFVVVVVLLGSLVAATGLAAWIGRLRARGRARLLDALATPRVTAAACAVLVVLELPPFLHGLAAGRLRLEVDPLQQPILAVRYLEDHDLGPNLAVRYDWGGYALCHLYPRYRVSIDGRSVTVYSDRFVSALLAAWYGGRALPLLAPYHPDVFLVESGGPVDRELLRNPGWQPVFRDGLAAVFVPRMRAAALDRLNTERRQYALTVPVFFP
jgi:hypothetical protein